MQLVHLFIASNNSFPILNIIIFMEKEDTTGFSDHWILRHGKAVSKKDREAWEWHRKEAYYSHISLAQEFEREKTVIFSIILDIICEGGEAQDEVASLYKILIGDKVKAIYI